MGRAVRWALCFHGVARGSSSVTLSSAELAKGQVRRERLRCGIVCMCTYFASAPMPWHRLCVASYVRAPTPWHRMYVHLRRMCTYVVASYVRGIVCACTYVVASYAHQAGSGGGLGSGGEPVEGGEATAAVVSGGAMCWLA